MLSVSHDAHHVTNSYLQLLLSLSTVALNSSLLVGIDKEKYDFPKTRRDAPAKPYLRVRRYIATIYGKTNLAIIIVSKT